MRKVILEVAVSLDGLIEGPNGEYDWCFTDQDYGMAAFMTRIDSIFYGRKSYEVALREAERSGHNPFAKCTSYVFSNTKSFDGVHVIGGDIINQVKKIKDAPGKDIWLFGGAELTTSLINASLVDELRMAIHPILLGSGKPLFQGIAKRIKTKLIDSKTYPSGLISVSYQIE